MTGIPFYAYVLSILMALGASWYLYSKLTETKASWRWSMALLRFIWVALLFALLFDPIYQGVMYQEEKPLLLTYFDVSESSSTLAPSYLPKALIDDWEKNGTINSKYDLEHALFARNIKYNSNGADSLWRLSTNLYEVEKAISKARRHRNVAGAVLYTDGIANSGRELSFSKLSGLPCYVVVLGDTLQKRDGAIHRILTASKVGRGNKFEVEIDMDFSLGDASSLPLEIFTEEGEKVYQSEIQGATSGRLTHSLILPSTEKKFQRYTVRLGSMSKEETLSNNEKSFVVEMVDREYKVAMVYKYLNPDMGLIRRTLELEPSYSVRMHQVDEDTDLLDAMEACVVFTKGMGMEELEDIRNKCSNLWLVNGPDDEATKEVVYGRLNSSFAAYTITDSVFFAAMPPLEGILPEEEVEMPISEVLLYSTINGVKLNAPLMFRTSDGANVNFVLNAGGIWRWAMEQERNQDSQEGGPITDIVLKTIDQLVSQDLKKKLIVDYPRTWHLHEVNELKVRLFNSSGEHRRGQRLSMTLFMGDEEIEQYSGVDQAGHYLFRVPSPETIGVYSFKITAEGSDQQFEGFFELTDIGSEKQDLVVRFEDMRNLAESSGGQVFMLKDEAELKALLGKSDNFKPILKKSTINYSLIHSEWLILILLLLIFLELLLRRLLNLK